MLFILTEGKEGGSKEGKEGGREGERNGGTVITQVKQYNWALAPSSSLTHVASLSVIPFGRAR